MKIKAPGNYLIEILPAGGNTNWAVRVYRKPLFHRRRLSSDWFLSEVQAREFAETVASELDHQEGRSWLKARPPGWTFRQAPR